MASPIQMSGDLDRCMALTNRGEFAQAEALYRQCIARDPFNRSLLLNYALMKRLADERDEAVQIIEHAAKACGSDAEMRAIQARIELERGGDAVPLYAQLARDEPGNLQHILGAAEAHVASGHSDHAIQLLEQAAASNSPSPELLATLSKLRWENGDADSFDRDFLQAIRQNPALLELRFAYCGMLASGQHYPRLLTAVEDARRASGQHRLFDMFAAQAFSETGEQDNAEKLFAALGPIDDYSFAAVRMRAYLKSGKPQEAAKLGQKFLSGPGANFIWPLMALAWRQCDEKRWRWLERFDETVKVVDLPLPADLLDRLQLSLRKLHSGTAHPMDLSARGGTQTRLNLLERSDPDIAQLRKIIREAVRGYIDGLPDRQADHPFLSQPRKNFRFAGSWSIRLGDAGHHVAHVHPAGWISSALYIAVPDSLDNARKEGWLALGGSPPELGLDCAPFLHVEPRPGRLVLFPSIMWHGTMPFAQGERMSVAFDILPFPE